MSWTRIYRKDRYFDAKIMQISLSTIDQRVLQDNECKERVMLLSSFTSIECPFRMYCLFNFI